MSVVKPNSLCIRDYKENHTSKTGGVYSTLIYQQQYMHIQSLIHTNKIGFVGIKTIFSFTMS